MPSKQFNLENIGTVNVYKSRKSKHLRLSLKHDGEVRISIPYWSSFRSGVEFALSKAEWIEQHRQVHDLLENGAKIGKAHRLVFIENTTDSWRSRISNNQVVVSYPEGFDYTHPKSQETAKKACQRALKLEAEDLLPQRLRVLADQHGFNYKSVGVRNLKSRWGSCNSKKEITLSYFLMQLSWKEIDYVLLHELTHTEHMSHGREFWAKMKLLVPDMIKIKNELKYKKPIIVTTDKAVMA